MSELLPAEHPSDLHVRAHIDDSELRAAFVIALEWAEFVDAACHPIGAQGQGPRASGKPESKAPHANRTAARCLKRLVGCLEDLVQQGEWLRDELNMTPEEREAKSKRAEGYRKLAHEIAHRIENPGSQPGDLTSPSTGT